MRDSDLTSSGSAAPMRGKPRTLDNTILDEGGIKKKVEWGKWRRRDFEIFDAPALSRPLSITSDRRYPSPRSCG